VRLRACLCGALVPVFYDSLSLFVAFSPTHSLTRTHTHTHTLPLFVSTLIRVEPQSLCFSNSRPRYLYLLFEEHDALPIDLDDYIFTTEAHLLPLGLGSVRLDMVCVYVCVCVCVCVCVYLLEKAGGVHLFSSNC
jgi:hypothetical protein